MLVVAAAAGLAAVARAGWTQPMPGATLDGVRLVRADGGGVSFEVEIPEPFLRPVGDPSRGIVALEIDGFEPTGWPGAPAVPERVVWIGVPEGATVEVLGTGLDVVDYGPAWLAPRVLRERPGSEELARAQGRLEAPSAPGDLASLVGEPAYLEAGGERPAAEVACITGMRGQTVAAIRLRPVTFDPASGRLRVARLLAVSARFVGGAIPVAVPPVEPAFEPVYHAVLVNAESARAFRRPMGDRLARSRAGGGEAWSPAGARAGARGLGFDIAPRWVKILVDAKGIHRVTGADLQALGVAPGSVDAAELRLFTRSGVPLLPEHTYCDTCGLDEVAIRVVGGEDGRFDAGDFFLFYGLPPSAWQDEFTGPGGAPAQWLDHPYETRNVYWLAWEASLAEAPRRWVSRDVAPASAQAWAAPFYSARAHFELNYVYQPDMFEPGIFWDQWAWSDFTDQLGAQVWQGDARGAVPGEPARLFARFWGQSQEWPRSAEISDHYLDVTFNDIPLARRTWDWRIRQDIDTSAVWIRETGNRLTARAPRQVDPNNVNRRDRQSLLFWELHFKRRFQALGDVVQFASPDTQPAGTEAVAYGVAPFSSGALATLRLLDVTDPNAPVDLAGWVAADTAGGKAIYFQDSAAARRFYYGAPASAFRAPAVSMADVRDIRGPGLGADYLVVTYDEFEPQAERLAALRRRILPGFTGAQAAVVRMSDVLAWYSGGRMDPTAVRNFLYKVSTSGRWSPMPSYVCFFGDASYDFKNVLRLAAPGRPAALVPSYVHGYYAGQFMTDDWLADVDLGPSDPPVPGIPSSPHDIPDFLIGRLPAGDAGDAGVLVDAKIAPYDERPTFGEWRNRALLVADDFYQGFEEGGSPKPDALWGTHLYQTEQIDNRALPPEVDRQKVYLSRYPFGVGGEKPGANADVKRRVNEGCLLWNYVGHGNRFKMADENAFILSDVSALTNLDRPTFMIAASCDVGKFDDPLVQGLGEALVKSATGGAIATFSSSDLAFSSDNASLNVALLKQIFASSAAGYRTTLGQASFLVKRRVDASANDRKYTLQGDPGTRLGSPQLDVRLALFDDETGAPLGDSLPRGRRVRLEGEVHGTHDTTSTDLRTDFGGTALVLVADSAPEDTFRLYRGLPQTLPYTYNPGPILRGDVPVVSGRLTARFYVPMEAVLGPRGKARAYVQSAATDGVGARNQRVVDGSPAEVDTTGPRIFLQFAGGSTMVGAGAELRIVLEDEHGINITGHSQPNAILLTTDEETRTDLTDQFRYDNGSFTRGTILYRLPTVAAGLHVIEVAAADNFAQGILGRRNRSRATIEFTMVGPGFTAAPRVMNFPNPFRPERGTQFVVNGLDGPAAVEVRVFSVDGKLVRALRGAGGPGQAQVGWNGRDEAGAPVANGVYLYRVEVIPADAGAPFRLEGRAAVLQ